MQCKDKFLLQSTKVPQSTDIDEIPPDTVSFGTMQWKFHVYLADISFVRHFISLTKKGIK